MSAVLEARFADPSVERADAVSTAGSGAERRLLERCAGQIADEAGPGTRVVELGGAGVGGHAALLREAIRGLVRAPVPALAPDRGRRLVFVPGARASALPVDRLAALLRRVREMSAPDTLLVIGSAIARREDLPRFERLAWSAGWEHCQLWSDGGARFAIHVLVRVLASPANPCVTHL